MRLPLLDLLFPPRESERVIRTLGADELTPYIRPLMTEEGITALLPYDEPPVRAAIIETKFHDDSAAAALLGGALSLFLTDYLSDCGAYEETACVLVPVPLSRERMRERGYNQSERIARHVTTGTGLFLDTALLMRIRDTAPQTSLSGSERRNNLCGAFALSQQPDSGTLYLLLDDVTTTGATMTEALRPFRKHRSRAEGICLAYSFGNAHEMQ